ncbi:hypothetical protein [Lacisediminimonas profundi]|uniref:hypothetical protein n=1 Tax=Lacisediminimonas profundi TaxID=2603856 RepID=UPI00124AF572|nr:hypothetical protein [Lacisediminimonas profundi]
MKLLRCMLSPQFEIIFLMAVTHQHGDADFAQLVFVSAYHTLLLNRNSEPDFQVREGVPVGALMDAAALTESRPGCLAVELAWAPCCL